MKAYDNGRDAVAAVGVPRPKVALSPPVCTATGARNPSDFGALALPPTRNAALATAEALIPTRDARNARLVIEAESTRRVIRTKGDS